MTSGSSAAILLPHRPRWLLVGMILMTAGYAGVFAFSLLMALTSPLVFDSGDTARNWTAFITILIFPLFLAGNVALAWCGYRYRRTPLIALGFVLPVAYMVAFWFGFQ